MFSTAHVEDCGISPGILYIISSGRGFSCELSLTALRYATPYSTGVNRWRNTGDAPATEDELCYESSVLHVSAGLTAHR